MDQKKFATQHRVESLPFFFRGVPIKQIVRTPCFLPSAGHPLVCVCVGHGISSITISRVQLAALAF